MERYPAIQLCHLREIGWREWNPLDLPPPEENAWRRVNIAEYDNHLLHAVCLLKKGGTVVEAAAYLENAAKQYQAEDAPSSGERKSAERTARALLDYLGSDGLIRTPPAGSQGRPEQDGR